MKRAFAIVGVCLLASIVVASMATTKQGLTLRAIPKPGSGTAVEFNLPKASEVNLSIYNVTGKKIKDIVQDQYLEAGAHSYAWDGRNELGKQVRSGVYFVHLQTDTQYRSLKLTYIKTALSAATRSLEGATTESGATTAVMSHDKKDVSRVEFLDELSPREQEILLGKSNEVYEVVKELARYISSAFPLINNALNKAIENSSEQSDHKVNLPSFIFEAKGQGGQLVSDILCKAGDVNKSKLRKMTDAITPVPYIFVPPAYKKWVGKEVPAVAVTPPCDDDSAQAIWAFNAEGQEFIIRKTEIPEFPVVVITAEGPIAEDNSPGYGMKRKAETFTLWVHKFRLHFGGDPLWDSDLEIYTKLWVEKGNGDDRDPYSTEFENINDKSTCDDYVIYTYDAPGKYVGNTTLTYPYFDRLKVYDRDPWWKGEGGGSDYIETFSFNHAIEIGDGWRWGDHGGCGGDDPDPRAKLFFICE